MADLNKYPVGSVVCIFVGDTKNPFVGDVVYDKDDYYVSVEKVVGGDVSMVSLASIPSDRIIKLR